MRILFVYPNRCWYPRCLSLGLAAVAGVLRTHGYEYSLADTTFGAGDNSVLRKVASFKPDLIAFSVVTTNFANAVRLAEKSKSCFPSIPILVGGIHPTVDPEGTISHDCFDMICLGEGEEAFLELVNSIAQGKEVTDIKNIWFKKDGLIIKNKLRKLVTDLDSIPMADVELYDYEKYLRNNRMFAPVMGSRGCPYKCSYCVNATLQKEYKGLGPFVRYRSVDNIIEEIKSTVGRHKNIRGIEFYDDTFTLDKLRVKEFCQKYGQEVGLPFYINARIDGITEDMCKDLSEAGCTRASVGLESGDFDIRQNVLNRKITDEIIIENCKLLKKYGIELYTYNMIGIPGETKEAVRKTIELNVKIQPENLSVSILNAFQGTQLYNHCRKKGTLRQVRPRNSFYTFTNIIHDHLDLRQLKRIRRLFGYNIYKSFDKKKAVANLIDRNLLGLPLYTRVRSIGIRLLGKRI